ncbi:MAG: alpha/beta hydrolase-fold protein [Gaiellaceae bacterium MAG52_C11]|nr:alpha/beta hydrolase-fold protein [Candidatus Gaiellasilicea maunaloa]
MRAALDPLPGALPGPEVRFAYRERGPRLARVQLAHDVPGLPHRLTRRGDTWELVAPQPEVDRLEYQFELIDRTGRSERIVDPENPLRASGPWGDKSVRELPGYEAPAWLDAKPLGAAESVVLQSRILRTELPALLWAHPDAGKHSPLLVAHDGPEYAEYSSLLTLLGQLPPVRAVLIAPVDRDETYSASARYARALAEELLPSFGADPLESGPLRIGPLRIGMGASLGALALLHAHRRYPHAFDALFLQSGSFFRRRDRHEARFPRFDRIGRFVGSVLAGRAERPIPVTIACGTIEDNLSANEAMHEALLRQGYDARFHGFRDGHNWVAWRDSFHPHLLRLLERA